MSTLKHGQVLHCFALDPKEARIREDAFHCRRTPGGIELAIVIVIPPISLLTDENTENCLNALFKSPRNLPDLFEKKDRIEHSLKENRIRPVLAVEYFINNRHQVRKEIVSSKYSRTSWIDHDNHDRQQMCMNAFEAVGIIHRNHKDGKILAKKATRWRDHNVSFDQHLSNLLCDLASFTCRATCRKIGVPYYHTGFRHGDILVSNPNHGRFHRPMRDAFALMNTLNLNNKITGNHDCLFEEKDMLSALKDVRIIK